MSKPNQTPEERIKYWMDRAKKMQKLAAKKSKELKAASELFELLRNSSSEKTQKLQELEKKYFDEIIAHTDHAIKSSNAISNLLVEKNDLQKKIEDLTSKKFEDAYDTDMGKLPEKLQDSVSLGNVSSEITDLLLDTGLYPAE